MGDSPLAVEKRVRVALGLQRSGIRMMRQNFIRRNADAAESEIDEMLRCWMRDRPGDAPGVPSRRFSD